MARKEFKTLTEQIFYILLVLNIPRHGYKIMSEIDKLTDNKIQIGAGTLYTLLPRFEQEGYIKLVKEENKRKIYQITDAGIKKLEDETKRMQTQINFFKNLY